MAPTYRIGSSTVPVEAAGTNTRILDPLLLGLLDYFAFWIRLTLNDKLAEMGGPIDSNAITDACPSDHLFTWDHKSTFTRKHTINGVERVPLPGMWAWEESSTSTKEGATLWFGAVQRTIRLHWIFPELQVPGFGGRAGMQRAVGDALLQACDKGLHQDYGYNGDPAGTLILTSLGLHTLSFERGAPGRLEERPTASVVGNGGAPASSGAVQRFFPAYDCTLKVIELIGQRDIVLPDDALIEGRVTINHGEDANDTTLVLERTIPGPDELVP